LLAFSPDSRTLVAAASGKVLLWEVETEKQSRVLWETSTGVNGLAFSPDGKALLVVDVTANYGWTTRMTLLSVATGEVVKSSSFRGYLFSVAFSPEGKTLAGSGNVLESNQYQDRLRFWGE
jgi:WD40 repeat protein